MQAYRRQNKRPNHHTTTLQFVKNCCGRPLLERLLRSRSTCVRFPCQVQTKATQMVFKDLLLATEYQQYCEKNMNKVRSVMINSYVGLRKPVRSTTKLHDSSFQSGEGDNLTVHRSFTQFLKLLCQTVRVAEISLKCYSILQT